MTTTLVVSSKVEAAVKPKPTKRELIEAMAILQFNKTKQDADKLRDKRTALSNEIDNDCRRVFKAQTDGAVWDVTRWGSSTIYLKAEITIRDIPDSIQKKLSALNSMPMPRWPDLKAIRKEITSRIDDKESTSDRVQTLVNTEESAAGLRKVLKSIGM